MNYTESGFRSVYHNFVLVSVNDRVEEIMRSLPGGEEANGILAYGYYDKASGITLEVLAAAIVTADGYRYAEGPEESLKIGIDTVKDEDLLICSNEDNILAETFSAKLEALRVHEPALELAETRDMLFLDEARDDRFIDDVLVQFIKEGADTESCWVRVNGHTDETVRGILIDEPYGDLGCHQGDTVSFRVYQSDDEEYTCYIDLDAEPAGAGPEAATEQAEETPPAETEDAAKPKRAPAPRKKKKE